MRSIITIPSSRKQIRYISCTLIVSMFLACVLVLMEFHDDYIVLVK
jgi:hypothetical protein